MLDVLHTPELAAQVTLQPLNRFDLDAAIIFSDILPPLAGMGLELDFAPGGGPHIANPIAGPRDIDRLAVPPAAETLAFTLEAIRLVQPELAARGTPLIGFAGAPLTLACYAIEGGTSKDFHKTKAMMFNLPGAWHRLMEKLTTVVIDYLGEQVAAGADALQVFDSWAGILSADDYEHYIAPFHRRLFGSLATTGVPIINFSTGTSAYLDLVADCGGDVVGIDWRSPLDRAWERIGHEKAIQGNLDPAVLLAPWREIQAHADHILNAAAGRVGHIFNLGHGILPQTPMDRVQQLVDYVHRALPRRPT
jgi:uroporphyrinogen decarboxylase